MKEKEDKVLELEKKLKRIESNLNFTTKIITLSCFLLAITFFIPSNSEFFIIIPVVVIFLQMLPFILKK